MIFITRPTHHILQCLLIYGTGQWWSDLEGGPVAGAPKVALYLGVGGGGAPQVPDGHGGPRDKVDVFVNLSQIFGLKSSTTSVDSRKLKMF